MRDDYATICGISEEELTTQLHEDIELMAQRNGTTYNDMFARMKARYDGYHFSEDLQDMYNPFSLFNAFASGKVYDYWFDRGTSGALIKMLAQIDRKGYAEKYRLDGRPVTKIGISFSSNERNITDWKTAPL